MRWLKRSPDGSPFTVWEYGGHLCNLYSLGWRDRDAGLKLCHYSLTSRAQSPLNHFYTWRNMLLTGLHHSPVVSIPLLLLLPSNSSILPVYIMNILSCYKSYGHELCFVYIYFAPFVITWFCLPEYSNRIKYMFYWPYWLINNSVLLIENTLHSPFTSTLSFPPLRARELGAIIIIIYNQKKTSLTLLARKKNYIMTFGVNSCKIFVNIQPKRAVNAVGIF